MKDAAVVNTSPGVIRALTITLKIVEDEVAIVLDCVSTCLLRLVIAPRRRSAGDLIQAVGRIGEGLSGLR